MRKQSAIAFLGLCVSLTSCATAPPVAPQPLKSIDPGRFFTGRWYEIARTPMKLTDGCVAGTTDYLTGPDSKVIDRDACRMGTPAGKEKTYQGPVQILNPGANNKVVVTYTVYGFIPVSRTYWMLDVDKDYRWFIVANPSFDNVSLFFRDPRPTPSQVSMVMSKAASLGYDVRKLEKPEEFAAGQQ